MKNNIKSIHCYEEKTWLAYHSGLLSESKRLAMEEHLLTCDSCLAIYLDIIERHISQATIPKLNRDFTDSVLGKIKREDHEQICPITSASLKKEKELILSKTKIFISYCAAASLALFFWSGGYFSGLADNLSKGVQYLDKIRITQKVVEPGRGIIQTGWTHKILKENRPSFIENFIPKEKE